MTSNQSCAEIVRLSKSLEEIVEENYDHFRKVVLKYCAPEWRSMILTITSVARKLCELQGQKKNHRESLFHLTNVRFIFGEEQKKRWNVRTFLFFLLNVPYVNPKMAFILMRLIEWIAEYPGLVSFYQKYFKKPEPNCVLYQSFEDGKEDLIHNTDDFFLFIIHMNNVFKKRLPSALFLQDVVFPYRITGLCGPNPFIVFKNTSRGRIRILRKSSLISLLIKRTFQGFSHQDLSHLMLFLAEYIYRRKPLEG